MSGIKKILSCAIALAAVASLMTGCPNNKTKKEGSEESKKQLRIYVWNEDFKERLRAYYPGYDKEKSEYEGDGKVGKKEFLKDGTEIVFLTTPTTGNAYQQKLDEDLRSQEFSDMKVDMFLAEADYISKYANCPYTMSISDLGITESDTKDQYKYTKDMATSADGELKALSWQSNPGLFVYKDRIAEDVLGTSDPNEVQKALSDWNKFDDVSKKMKDKGYCMLSGYEDAYRPFSSNMKKPWVNENDEIVFDSNIEKWINQTMDYTNKGYNNKTTLWSDAWQADQGDTSKVFGYFCAPWTIDFTLKDHIGEDFGHAKACPGPQPFYWGGTWLCAAEGTDNKDLVKDIMLSMTCNKDILLQITKEKQDYTNTMSGMEEFAKSGYQSPILGGQNYIALLTDVAKNINGNNVSAFDQGITESLHTIMNDYYMSILTKEEALDKFYESVIEKYPELKRKD